LKKFKKVLRIVSILIALILTLILLSLIYWYINSFHAYKINIDTAIMESKLELGEVSEEYKLASFIEGKRGLVYWGSRVAFSQIAYDYKNPRSYKWHFGTFLWAKSINFWYCEKEIFYIWAKYTYFYKAVGLKKSAIKVFNKELKDLSLKEKVMLIIMSKRQYKLESKEFNERVDKVMKSYIEKYGE